MTRHAIRLGPVALVTIVVIASCSSSDRPSDLSLSEIGDACELISSSDYQQLRVPIEPESLDFVSGVDTDGTTCSYQVLSGDRITPGGNSVMVSTITNHGIDQWTDGSFESSKFQDVARVQRFRTIQVWNTPDRPAPNDRCRLYVDVAGGESLRIMVGESDEEDPPTCDTARRFADAAVQTLIDRS